MIITNTTYNCGWFYVIINAVYINREVLNENVLS